MLNPFLARIDGDLSRADAVVLVQACRGKDVVEFGVGASTILLSQCARSLISIDTCPVWLERVQAKLKEIEMLCRPQFIHIPKDSRQLPQYACDVFFNDGFSLLRIEFLRAYWIDYVREQMLLHDARTSYATNMVKAMMDWYEPRDVGRGEIWAHNPYVACLERIDWCPLESNMVALRKRNCSLRYENWNVTERGDKR